MLDPSAEVVTLTCAVQLPPAGIVPPEKLSAFAPAEGFQVAPAQVVLAPGVLATVIPAGSVSLKAAPVSARPELGFDNVKVRVVVPPAAMIPGENTLAKVGAVGTPQPVNVTSSR